MYWRILLTASMWGSLGSARNWLNQSTTNVMSSLVKVRYNNIPITLLYWFAFGSSFPWSFERCRFCSIGVLTGLDPKLLVSCRISKAYFLWFRLIPLSLLATSSPKIYLREPKSFRPNSASSKAFNSWMHLGSFLVSKISSTYTSKTVNDEPLVWVKRE